MSGNETHAAATEKKCTRCRKAKPLDAFALNANKTRTGRASRCKACINQRNKQLKDKADAAATAARRPGCMAGHDLPFLPEKRFAGLPGKPIAQVRVGWIGRKD